MIISVASLSTSARRVCGRFAVLGAVGVSAAILVPTAAAPAPAAAPAVTATIPVGIAPLGVGNNPVTNTVYVTNNGDNTVSVISGETQRVTATIAVGPAPSARRSTR